MHTVSLTTSFVWDVPNVYLQLRHGGVAPHALQGRMFRVPRGGDVARGNDSQLDGCGDLAAGKARLQCGISNMMVVVKEEREGKKRTWAQERQAARGGDSGSQAVHGGGGARGGHAHTVWCAKSREGSAADAC